MSGEGGGRGGGKEREGGRRERKATCRPASSNGWSVVRLGSQCGIEREKERETRKGCRDREEREIEGRLQTSELQRLCVGGCVCVCVCACVRACVRACVHDFVCAHVYISSFCVFVGLFLAVGR